MTSQDRVRGAVAALTVQALLGWLLIAGLATTWRHPAGDALAVFRVAPPLPPPPPVVEQPRRSARLPSASAPPNLRSTATDVVAPPPVIPPTLPPPVVAAITPGIGTAATSGAASTAGSGTGAGGLGSGFDGGPASGGGSPPRWRRGQLKDADYPPRAGQQGTSGIVGVRYLVGADGRVGECQVVRSSGSRDLDDTTCRLIQQRFRFDPSRDAHGRTVPAWVVETHEWVIDHPPPSP